jgi:hypothetical protein
MQGRMTCEEGLNASRLAMPGGGCDLLAATLNQVDLGVQSHDGIRSARQAELAMGAMVRSGLWVARS